MKEGQVSGLPGYLVTRALAAAGSLFAGCWPGPRRASAAVQTVSLQGHGVTLPSSARGHTQEPGAGFS